MEDAELTEPSLSSASTTVVKKRGIFPKPATNILRAWLFQNLAVSTVQYSIADSVDAGVGRVSDWANLGPQSKTRMAKRGSGMGADIVTYRPVYYSVKLIFMFALRHSFTPISTSLVSNVLH